MKSFLKYFFILANFSLHASQSLESDPLAPLRYDFRDETACPICLEEFADLENQGISVIVPKCLHHLCKKCFDRLKCPKSCPLCQKELSYDQMVIKYSHLLGNQGILLWPLNNTDEQSMLKTLETIEQLRQESSIDKNTIMEILDPLRIVSMHDLPLFESKYLSLIIGNHSVHHERFDYLSKQFLHAFSNESSQYVLIGTGLHRNIYKSNKTFPMLMAQMLELDKKARPGKLIYLSNVQVSSFFIKYLFFVANKSKALLYNEQWLEDNYRHFRNKYLSFPELLLSNRVEPLFKSTGPLSLQATLKYLLFLEDKTQKHIVGITTNDSCDSVEQWTKIFHVPYLNNPTNTNHLQTRANTRKLFKSVGVNHPKGSYKAVNSWEELVDEIFKLLKSTAQKKVIVKRNNYFGKKNTRVLYFRDISFKYPTGFIKGIIRRHVTDGIMIPEWFLEGGLIVEEYLECKRSTSPASIYMINGENNVKLEYDYQRTFNSVGNFTEQGSFGPMGLHEIEEMTHKIAMAHSQQGIRGYQGINFMRCFKNSDKKTSSLYAIENNPGVPKKGYAYYTFKTLLGEKKMSRRFMTSFIQKIIGNEFNLKGMISNEFFSKFLRNHPHTLALKTGKGCLVLSDDLYKGKIKVACVAKSKPSLKELCKTFSKSVEEFFVENNQSTKPNILPYSRVLGGHQVL